MDKLRSKNYTWTQQKLHTCEDASGLDSRQEESGWQAAKVASHPPVQELLIKHNRCARECKQHNMDEMTCVCG